MERSDRGDKERYREKRFDLKTVLKPRYVYLEKL